MQRNSKGCPIQRKKTVPEIDLMAELLDEFETTVLMMLKELKEDSEKVKKMM